MVGVNLGIQRWKGSELCEVRIGFGKLFNGKTACYLKNTLVAKVKMHLLSLVTFYSTLLSKLSLEQLIFKLQSLICVG